MKKKINILICVCILVAVLATVFAGCTPPTPVDNTVKYAVTPLADLTDYSSTATKAAVSYNEAGDGYADARNALEAKIKTEKSYYDNFAEGEATYLRYTAADLVNGVETQIVGRYEAGERVEQSSLIKILAHADADQLIYVLGYSGLEQSKMISLINYIAKDGANAKDKPSEATGLIEDYQAIQDWNNEYDAETNDDAKQEIYKKRARKSRAMNARLFATGMDGGDAGRAIIEVFEYAQIVAEEMRTEYNLNNGNDTIDNMTDYFKKELLDYDTVVLIRANNDRRWGTEGQSKNAMREKDVVYNQSAHNYNGSYAKPSADAALVQAYGYSYDYEHKNYDSLSNEDFEKELVYRFKSRMELDEAKDYSRIQRTQYEKAFRYSDSFYTKYYAALHPINECQEKYERFVFGFTDEDVADGDPIFKGASSTVKVQGVGGDATEDIISVDMGGRSATSYSYYTKQAMDIGIKDQLKAGDMQHYYWGIEANIKAQNEANNDRMSTNAGNQAKGEFNLKLVNLKMTDFVLSTFVNEKNTAGLANLMKAQTRLYVADYARMTKALRRQVVREIAKLEKDGVLKATRSGNDVYYVAESGYATPEQQETVRDKIGRTAVMITNLDNKIKDLDVASKETGINGTDWATISTQVRETVEFDYTAKDGKDNWGTKSITLEDQLIRKEKDANGEFVLDENGNKKYDTNWKTSVFVNNNQAVLAYSSGQIDVTFQVGTGVSNDGKIAGTSPREKLYGYSGDTVAEMISDGVSFGNLTGGSGSVTYTATADTNRYYLKWDSVTGKYYYAVNLNDVLNYDTTLYVRYTITQQNAQ